MPIAGKQIAHIIAESYSSFSTYLDYHQLLIDDTQTRQSRALAGGGAELALPIW